MVTKSPAMPLYIKDLYTDVPTLTLTFAAQGLYIRLLAWQWTEGSIPSDPKLISKVIGREKEVRRLWKEVRPMFDLQIADGFVANSKLERVRAEMEEFRESKRVAGAKGGRQRVANAQAKGQAELKQNSSTMPSTAPSKHPSRGPSKFNPSSSSASASAIDEDITQVASSPLELPVNGDDATEVIQSALRCFAPHLDADEFTVSVWLRDICPDPWWIAAAIAESELHLRNARVPGYVTKLLKGRRDEGWECEDAQGYAQFRMARRTA